jgi:tRNA (Thr-GGU) A37 N-methylase
MMTFRISAIGFVVGGRGPAEDDHWDTVEARIDLDPLRFGKDALLGLDAFSHAEIVFVFDGVAESDIVEGARHPRDNRDWPRVGIFAQRGRNRPNRLGVSICRIVSVDGTSLHVTGLDAIDGTPVVDIKPVLSGFQPRGAIREPAWAREIMADYW